jgi:hypothetical protein
MVKRTAATFSAASMEAAKTFVELMGQLHAPSVRLGAARNIVQLGLQLREHTDLLEELAELRRMITTPQPSDSTAPKRSAANRQKQDSRT